MGGATHDDDHDHDGATHDEHGGRSATHDTVADTVGATYDTVGDTADATHDTAGGQLGSPTSKRMHLETRHTLQIVCGSDWTIICV